MTVILLANGEDISLAELAVARWKRRRSRGLGLTGPVRQGRSGRAGGGVTMADTAGPTATHLCGP